MRLRARVPRSDRVGFAVVQLTYLVAALQCAVAVTVLATTATVRASILATDPAYTPAQWRTELAGSIDPLVVIAWLAVIVLVWVAWLSGRGRRWARALLVANFAVTTYSLLHGMAGGSATYARVDLEVGFVLWLVELATLALIAASEAQRIAASRSGGSRVPAADPGVAYAAASRAHEERQS